MPVRVSAVSFFRVKSEISLTLTRCCDRESYNTTGEGNFFGLGLGEH